MRTTEVIFWVALLIVAYTYVGYGILLYILVKIKEFLVKPQPRVPEELPSVTLLIAAYNEEDIVREKMANTGQIIYPPDKLNVVWVTDGSSDGTNKLLSDYSNVRLLYEEKRGGKTAALNRAMPYIESPIVIFTDANTMLNREAVMEIVKAFSDPEVGCVAGEKRISAKERDKASSGGEGIYWKYESTLKDLDSRLYTAVGAAGELFAIRRNLFEEMEPDTLLDDFILSMKIAQKGFRIRYCSSAFAIEDGSYDMAEEKKRKVRIAAGGIQSVYRLIGLLNFFRRPVLSFQYISHRVLRWTITPVLLFLLLPLNIAVVLQGSTMLYSVLLLLQILFYALGLLGKLMEERKVRSKVLFIPFYFLFMNVNVIAGFLYLLKKSKGDGTWERAKRI